MSSSFPTRSAAVLLGLVAALLLLLGMSTLKLR